MKDHDGEFFLYAYMQMSNLLQQMERNLITVNQMSTQLKPVNFTT